MVLSMAALVKSSVCNARTVAWRCFKLKDHGAIMRMLVADSARAIKVVSDGARPGAEDRIRCQVARLVQKVRLGTEFTAKSVVITGFARSGKSLLAETLARSPPYTHIPLDMVKEIYWNIEDNDLRNSTRLVVPNTLLNRSPRGPVIEGDDLFH